MNNISANGRVALRAVQNGTPSEKLLRCRKIIVPLESNPPNETSDRILEDLRRTLRTVQKATDASSEEVAAAGDLLLRVKALSVRRDEFRESKNGNGELSIEELENTNSRTVSPDPAKYTRPVVPEPMKAPDGFIRGFIHPEEAIARCSVTGFTPATQTINDPEKILQVALGDIQLDGESVQQLWLTWGYTFVERWNRTLSPMALKLQTSILHYTQTKGLALKSPDIFTFADHDLFRGA